MKLNKGQKYYRLNNMTETIDEFIYIKENLFESNNIIIKWPTNILLPLESKDLCLITKYKLNLQEYSRQRNLLQENLETENKKIQELNNQFKHLKDKYPEEFI